MWRLYGFYMFCYLNKYKISLLIVIMISFIYCNISSIKLSPFKKLSFEQEYNFINNMFPYVKFYICMNLDKINTSVCND